MAITDWEITDAMLTRPKEQILKPTTILTDKTSGFSDPEFWGNIILLNPKNL